MTSLLRRPSDRERILADMLREQAIDVIAESDLSVAAEKLDLAEMGVKTLVARPHWSLEKAFRVADALGLIDEDGPISWVNGNGSRRF